jgi:hypothetical protein
MAASLTWRSKELDDWMDEAIREAGVGVTIPASPRRRRRPALRSVADGPEVQRVGVRESTLSCGPFQAR